MDTKIGAKSGYPEFRRIIRDQPHPTLRSVPPGPAAAAVALEPRCGRARRPVPVLTLPCPWARRSLGRAKLKDNARAAQPS